LKNGNATVNAMSGYPQSIFNAAPDGILGQLLGVPSKLKRRAFQ
jgi:hypothetical protein